MIAEEENAGGISRQQQAVCLSNLRAVIYHGYVMPERVAAKFAIYVKRQPFNNKSGRQSLKLEFRPVG
ncbi:MAG: hypothetical protein OQK77_08100 [Psychromonas sp.]|nr:hypothetical protein [Psychromonas sp.]